ncbi:MED11-like protein [Mya arenaria]|uniref:Mediator of RNA polymerase II transcription subunit 11 n=1 Tax=Mya arenaria TaxID=6604 RepID=A0ABY7G4S1_MYAAR|nr:MED11-like protein [Mya arenaria]
MSDCHLSQLLLNGSKLIDLLPELQSVCCVVDCFIDTVAHCTSQCSNHAESTVILPNPEGSSADAACLQSVNMNNCVTSLPVNANECSFYIRLRLSLVTDTEFNMAASGPVERLQQLETIEKDVSNAILSAGKALEELSKEKPQMKMIENHTTGFMKTLEGVEVGLMKQINYLTQKDLLMGYHRMAHVRSRLEELEKIRTDGKPKLLQLAKSYSMPPMAKPGQLPGN